MGGVKWRLILERRAIKRCGREGEGEVEVGEVGEGVEVGGGGGGGGAVGESSARREFFRAIWNVTLLEWKRRSLREFQSAGKEK